MYIFHWYIANLLLKWLDGTVMYLLKQKEKNNLMKYMPPAP